MEKVIKYLSKTPEKKNDRVLRFIGSDESIDRDNERILSSGWKLTNYRKNPVILLNHKHSELPVAKAKKVWIDKDKKRLMFDVQFPEPEVSSVGDTLYKLYSNGFMNATSVGFRPNPEKIKYGEGGKKGPSVTFQEQELLELSLVSVPANPRALLTQKGIQEAIDNDVIDPVELNELEMLFDQLFKEEPEIEVKDVFTEEIEDEEDVDIDKQLEETLKEIQKKLQEEDQQDPQTTEQNINECVNCPHCGKDINQDDSDGDYLEKLFEDFGKQKANTEDENEDVVDELLNSLNED